MGVHFYETVCIIKQGRCEPFCGWFWYVVPKRLCRTKDDTSNWSHTSCNFSFSLASKYDWIEISEIYSLSLEYTRTIDDFIEITFFSTPNVIHNEKKRFVLFALILRTLCLSMVLPIAGPVLQFPSYENMCKDNVSSAYLKYALD